MKSGNQIRQKRVRQILVVPFLGLLFVLFSFEQMPLAVGSFIESVQKVEKVIASEADWDYQAAKLTYRGDKYYNPDGLVPASIQKEARKSLKLNKKRLPEPVLKAGNAQLKGKFYAYLPEIGSQLTLCINNPVLGIQEDHVIRLDENGEFAIEVPLVTTTQAFIISPFLQTIFVLSPGEESGIWIDLNERRSREARIGANRDPESKYIFFTGAFADINNLYEDLNYGRYQNKYFDYERMRTDILGMDALQYKEYILKLLDDAISSLKENGFVGRVGEIARFDLINSALYYLLWGELQLTDAYQHAHNKSRQEPLPDDEKPVFTDEYYSFLREFSLNNPYHLYVSGFPDNIQSSKHIGVKSFMHPPVSAEMIRLLREAGCIKPEDMELAGDIEKMAYDSWSEEQQQIFRDGYLQITDKLLASSHLTEKDKKGVADYQLMLRDPATPTLKLLSARNAVYEALEKHNTGSDGEQILQSGEIFGEAIGNSGHYLQASDLFTEKYQEEVTGLTSQLYYQEAKERIKKIMGYDEGLYFDLIESQDYGRGFEGLIPLNKLQLYQLSQMKDPFYLHYMSAKNEKLLARIASQKSKGGYRTHPTPEVEYEELIEEISKPYRGKVVMIDFWATWCAPCRSAMVDFEEQKSRSGEDVVFIYITDESSPLQAWENMIPGIAGEHYRLSPGAYEFLRKKYKIEGVPSYLILNKEGKQVYFKTGFDKNEITAVLNKMVKE